MFMYAPCEVMASLRARVCRCQIGNYVLAKVLNDVNGFECYVPGTIHMLPKCSSHSDQCHCQIKFYTVILFNGQKASRRHTVESCCDVTGSDMVLTSRFSRSSCAIT